MENKTLLEIEYTTKRFILFLDITNPPSTYIVKSNFINRLATTIILFLPFKPLDKHQRGSRVHLKRSKKNIKSV